MFKATERDPRNQTVNDRKEQSVIETSGFLSAADFQDHEHLLCFHSLIEEQVATLRNKFQGQLINELLIIRQSLPQLLKQLNLITLPTLCLEINVARINGQLPGNNPQARFRSFIHQLADPLRRRQFFQEYPVLLERLQTVLHQWQQNTLRIWQRLEQDFSLLRQTFDQQLGPFTGFAKTTGDTHAGGQQVLICCFANGSQVVYKPRSMAADVRFQHLCQQLNSKLSQEVFRPIRVLDRGCYGWAEFVPYKPCNNTAELTRYYHRLGHHLALLDALKASDFHHENIVIHGEYPVLIDLETLTQTQLSDFHGTFHSRENASDSILATGLLPQVTPIDANHCLDISALGASEQPYFSQQMTLKNPGTDHLRLGPETKSLRLQDCQPVSTESTAFTPPHRHTAEVIEGYEQLHKLLSQHQVWFSDTVCQQLFTGHRFRCVMRPTQQYMRWLLSAAHPDLMRSAEQFSKHLNRLTLPTEVSPMWQQVLQAEQMALKAGDVPLFYFAPDSTNLQDAHGNAIHNALRHKPLKLWLKHFKDWQLSSTMARKRWLIKASFSAKLLTEQTEPAGWMTGQLHNSPSGPEHNVFSQINQQLIDLANHEAVVSWPDVHHHAMSWQILPAGFDLYDGLPGISLYLNHWLRFNQDATLAGLNQRLNQQLLSALSQMQQPGKPGAFTGIAGQLYWLEHCCDKTDPEVQRLRSTLLQRLSNQMCDQSHDVIDGAAGCLMVLCGLHEHQPEPVISQLAQQCARQLMSGRVNQTVGCGWLMPELQQQPVSGFAHGGLGVAYALARYATTFGDASPMTVIGDALAYEHHLYTSQQNRWMDSRKDAEYRSVNAWCTGSVGAGIAALELNRLLPEQAGDWGLLRTTELASQAAIGQLHTISNDSLCHGTTGMLHLLHEVSRDHPEFIQADQYQRLKQQTISRMKSQGIRCGLPKIPLTLPGLMRGVSGVGLELLRQETNNQTPNVLTLS